MSSNDGKGKDKGASDQKVVKTILLASTRFQIGDDWTTWKLKFMRTVIVAGCKEDLMRDTQDPRPVINQCVEHLCGAHPSARSVLKTYVKRPDENVNLLYRLNVGMTSKATLIKNCGHLLGITPDTAEAATCADWAFAVEQAAGAAGVDVADNWLLLLVLFVTRSRAPWRESMGQDVWNCADWAGLHGLVLKVSINLMVVPSVETVAGATVAASPAKGTPGRKVYKCFNCNEPGHFSGECPKPKTERTSDCTGSFDLLWPIIKLISSRLVVHARSK